VITPVLAKHSKSFSLIDCVSVGVDRMQRNFEPMRRQVETWQRSELRNVTAKVVSMNPFVEGKLEAPKHLARTVHDLYFEPKYEDFQSRTIWSRSNALTSAFKELDPIPQFRATAKLGEFLEVRVLASFLRKHGGAGGPPISAPTKSRFAIVAFVLMSPPPGRLRGPLGGITSPSVRRLRLSRWLEPLDEQEQRGSAQCQPCDYAEAIHER
jgi:hypothetical protein